MPTINRLLYMRLWMIGVVLGILASVQVSDPPGIFTLGVMLLGALVLSVSAPIWPRPALALGCSGALLGVAYACYCGLQLLERRVAADCVGIPVVLEGTVASLPRRSQIRSTTTTTRQRFEFLLQNVKPQRCTGPQRVLLSYYGERELSAGQRWRFHAKLKKPWGLANPGSFNMQNWYAQTAIDAVGSIRSDQERRLAGPVELRFWHHRLRQRISRRVTQLGFESEVQAVLQAITVADKSAVDGNLWRLLQRFGVNHLLVISGLHISLVAAAGYFLGGWLARVALLLGAYRLAALLPGVLALSLAFSYAALAGFALATVRAVCMLSCFLIAGWLGRHSSPWNNLLLAALVVLLVNPLAGVGAGFYLSFGAVSCLLWLGHWQPGRGWGLRILATHGYMSLAMLPLGAWWFGGASGVAALANMLLIPLVGLLIVPLALLAVLANFCQLSLEPQLWRAAAWPVEHLLALARPLAQDHAGQLYYYLSPSALAAVLAALGVVTLLIPGLRQLRLLALLLILPLGLLPAPVDIDSEYLARVTVLDVGQGTAVVLQSGPMAMVYDTGGGDPHGSNMATSVLLPFLRDQGIRQLDTLIISHPDQDHSAGTTALRRALPVKRLLYGGELSAAAGGEACRAGQAWQWPGGLRFQLMSPAAEPGLSTNNSSCVLLLSIAGLRILLPGDIDASRERQLVRYWGDSLRADWLLAGHHGSATSSSWVWVKTVAARGILFSHGYANRFGHPHSQVEQRFAEAGATSWSTAAGGAVQLLVSPGGEVQLELYRPRHRRYWW